MQQNLSSNSVRLNIQVSPELKRRLVRVASMEGEKISVLVRKYIEDSLNRIEKSAFEQKMKQAYVDLAQENLDISEDFKYADAENIT